ncbi:MAG: ankyrin repeat domain-containing protein, partial [Gemmatimonadales bacterium]
MKIFFWLFVALDVVALVTFGLLGLAAAGPSRTNPIAALVIPFFIPGAILLAAIALYIRAETTGLRLAALLIAALPVMLVVGGRGLMEVKLGGYKDDSGAIRQFRSGALRDIEAAIDRNDSAAVAAAAPGTDLNTPGLAGATVLVLALRHLPKAPDQLGVLRALLAAGADPNAGSAEPPLQPAIGASRTAGPEPVRLLLEAGADPNARTEGGEPVFFIAGGANIEPAVMELLLARGADVQLRDRQ